MTMHLWTPEDSLTAIEEGWDLFTTDHDPGYETAICNGRPYGHRPFELQAVEERRIFRGGDHEAWRHVCRLAGEGSPLHLRALLFLGQESTAELQAVFEYWAAFSAGRSVKPT